MKRTIKTIILFFAFLIGASTYTVSAQNPPAHAQAHGVKKKYKYYPDCNVYFNPVTKRYTYYGGGRWTTVVNLPSSIRLTGNFNDFDFDGDDPWKENSKHKSQYKPNKSVKSSDLKKIDHDYDNHDNHNSNSNKGNGKKK
jgi:hypothetical protein